uniref:Methylcytosine dioxygenase TET n=1 Tax=Macrostomum lignano TaxID=282301 RepID=A0A1I8IZ88_9PLAT
VLFFFLLCTKAQYRYSGGIISFELFLCCIQLISRANNIVLQTELHSIEVCTALGAMASTEQRNDGGGGGGGGANDVSRQRKRIGLPPDWQAEQGKEIPPKVDTLNQEYKPSGGNRKIFKEKLDFSKNAKPKVETMSNKDYQPGGGTKKIFKERVNFSEKATPRLNTMENKDYEPKRNEIKVYHERLPWLEVEKLRLVSQQSDAIKDKPQQQEQQPAPTKRSESPRQQQRTAPREQPCGSGSENTTSAYRGEAKSSPAATSRVQLDNERSEQ